MEEPDSTEAWKHVIETMAEYDEKMVAGWKDELNNLLIFVCQPRTSFLQGSNADIY